MLRDESMHKSFEEGPLGRQLSAVVSSAMAKLVPDRYFKIGVQVGLRAGFFLQQAEQAYLLLDNNEQDPQTQVIQIASPECLPFGRHDVDLLVLPFVLEYSQSPHRVIGRPARSWRQRVIWQSAASTPGALGPFVGSFDVRKAWSGFSRPAGFKTG